MSLILDSIFSYLNYQSNVVMAIFTWFCKLPTSSLTHVLYRYFAKQYLNNCIIYFLHPIQLYQAWRFNPCFPPGSCRTIIYRQNILVYCITYLLLWLTIFLEVFLLFFKLSNMYWLIRRVSETNCHTVKGLFELFHPTESSNFGDTLWRRWSYLQQIVFFFF